MKCIYIDPPYNTKSAFDKYDDNLEHAKWLATICPRLELLRELLSENGSIWVSIDDNEAHYTDARFSQSERMKWCLAHVHYLVVDRGIPLSALWRAKFILARKLIECIKAMKAKEATKAYQQYLFAPEAKTAISFDDAFVFSEGMYDVQKPYRGKFRFKNHFLEIVPAMDDINGREESQCAMAIDSLPEIKHWLRNVSQHPASFKLPLAQGWTYPDFVAELKDGRLLVVEYKRADRLNTPETKEKKLIGELWESQMNGKGLYLMAVKDAEGKDVRAQLMEKTA